jgi:HPt (histidine-containing phosphotransfer) domain-containing protein
MNKLVNLNELIAHYEEDTDLVLELVGVFEDTYLETVEALEHCFESKNYQDFEVSAHTLKGMLSNFFANDLIEKAALLEKMGEEQRLDNALEIIVELKKLIPAMLNEIKAIQRRGEDCV